ncbi:MAG: DNA adenine methylase [Alistipes sp.]|uniref:DNA adenine methylase n=1 Tax=Alistipes sp. TaxID=1872444 RepID=UPI0023F335F1|nr:DNA adenine methylase [Alistipes sp.]MBQ7892842.1 DNA adenine methylase [Alistipes sp.]
MIDNAQIPHFIKYMGSKREILDRIHFAIEMLNVDSEWFCDLFAGTSVVGGSLKHLKNVQVNDIQIYSSIFANTYFSNYKECANSNELTRIKDRVLALINEFDLRYPELNYDYSKVKDFDLLIKFESEQQKFINKDFEIGFSLFTKYYSGTYWSSNQCKWIDSIRAIAEEYKGLPEYYAILSSLMFAMSYASQSTGHFAQYRDVTKSNMNDILIYRNKNIWNLFAKKFQEIISIIDTNSNFENRITTLDYVDCLRIIEENSIVYADPPYTNVHYSRFYHALETLVKYDHPPIKYKGRYREDRHQSPFDIKTEVKNAFRLLFKGVRERNSHLILSYSNNGMITLDEILHLGKLEFGNEYAVDVKSEDYIHMKMGRVDEYQMDVKELIISYKRL